MQDCIEHYFTFIFRIDYLYLIEISFILVWILADISDSLDLSIIKIKREF